MVHMSKREKARDWLLIVFLTVTMIGSYLRFRRLRRYEKAVTKQIEVMADG